MKKSLAITLALLLVIITGFSLRIYKLSDENIWYDEVSSVYYSQQSLSHILSLRDTSPPLYYVLLHFIIILFGGSEFSIRFLSVLFGTASIYFLYLLGKELFNRKVGFFSALLLALSPLHVYYSQEARTYSLLIFLTIMSMYYYIRLDKKTELYNIILYIVTTGLLLYSHVYSIFLVISQNMHQIYKHRLNLSKLKKWFLIQLVIAVFYLPWIIYLAGIVNQYKYSWIPKPTIIDLLITLYTYSSGEIFSLSGLVLIFLFIALIIYFIKSRFFVHVRDKFIILVFWALSPIFIPFLYSIFFTPIFTSKYTIISSVPLYIISGFVFTKTNHRKIRTIFFLIITFLIIVNLIQATSIKKDQWKLISDYIKGNANKNELVYVIEDYEILPFSYYFNNGCFKDIGLYNCMEKSNIYPLNETKLKNIKDKNFWLILSNKNNKDGNKERIVDYINKNYKVVSQKEFTLKPDIYYYNTIHQFLKDKNLIKREYNLIRVYHLKRI